MLYTERIVMHGSSALVLDPFNLALNILIVSNYFQYKATRLQTRSTTSGQAQQVKEQQWMKMKQRLQSESRSPLHILARVVLV